MRASIFLSAILALSSCASNPGFEAGGVAVTGPISRNQCASFDWRGAGVYDGARGEAQPTRFNYLRMTCSSHGYTADEDAYFEGYEEGRAFPAE